MLLIRTLLTAVLIVTAIPGCQNTSTPDAFGKAVSRIIQLNVTIREGFAAGDIDAAHGPLHEIGSALDQLAGVAADDGITEEKLKLIKSAVEQLMDAYGAVDKTLHGGDGSTYEEERANIDAGLAALAELADVETADRNTSASSLTEPAATVEVEDVTEPTNVVPVEAVPVEVVPAE